MKLTHILAAGLMMAGVGVSTQAAAQNYRGNDRGYDHRDNDRGDRNGRWNRHDNGNHYGWRNKRHRQHCRTEWRHHHRVRICR